MWNKIRPAATRGQIGLSLHRFWCRRRCRSIYMRSAGWLSPRKIRRFRRGVLRSSKVDPDRWRQACAPPSEKRSTKPRERVVNRRADGRAVRCGYEVNRLLGRLAAAIADACEEGPKTPLQDVADLAERSSAPALRRATGTTVGAIASDVSATATRSLAEAAKGRQCRSAP